MPSATDRMSTYSISPLEHFENILGLERFQPRENIGFKDGVKSLATRTRAFFGGLFGMGKKR